MSELRKKFEVMGNIKTAIWSCTFDESDNEYRSERLPEYSLGFVNGAWYALQEQESKIEKLEEKLKIIEQWVVKEKHHIPMSEWHGYTTEEYVDADDLLDVLRGEHE